jgi:hypothetical protein
MGYRVALTALECSTRAQSRAARELLPGSYERTFVRPGTRRPDRCFLLKALSLNGGRFGPSVAIGDVETQTHLETSP